MFVLHFDDTQSFRAVTSGYGLGEKGHYHKNTLWAQSTRVPFLIHVPPRISRVLPTGVSRTRRV